MLKLLLDLMSMESKHAKLNQLQTRFAAVTCINRRKYARVREKLGQSMSKICEIDNVVQSTEVKQMLERKWNDDGDDTKFWYNLRHGTAHVYSIYIHRSLIVTCNIYGR